MDRLVLIAILLACAAGGASAQGPSGEASANSAFSDWDRICQPHLGNRSQQVAELKAKRYRQVAKDSNGLEAWSRADQSATITLGRGSASCMLSINNADGAVLREKLRQLITRINDDDKQSVFIRQESDGPAVDSKERLHQQTYRLSPVPARPDGIEGQITFVTPNGSDIGQAWLFAAAVAAPVSNTPGFGWLKRPQGETLSKIYPPAAQKRGIEGEVVLNCLTNKDGTLRDCGVAMEKPRNVGFGAAALSVSPSYQLGALDNSGSSPEGLRVFLPIYFRLSYDDAPDYYNPRIPAWTERYSPAG